MLRRRCLVRSFYFRQTHTIDTTEKISLGAAGYWLHLGRIDSEQAEGLGLDGVGVATSVKL